MKKNQFAILKPLKKYLSSKGKSFRALGVTAHKNSIYLYYQNKDNTSHSFNVARSKDGFNFSAYRKDLIITNFKKTEDISKSSDFHFTKLKKYYLLRYKKKSDKRTIYATATTSDLLKFEYNYYSPLEQDQFVIIPEKIYKTYHLAYTGEYDISVSRSKDLKHWEEITPAVLSPRPDFFDNAPLEIEFVMQTEKGILLLYHVKKEVKGHIHYLVGVALFDKDNPSKLLWRSQEPAWQQPEEWNGRKVDHLGIAHLKGNIISYWNVEGEGIFAVIYSLYNIGEGIKIKNISLNLKKVDHNPILSPQSDNHWEAFNTFNPAALYEDGKVHLLYRAQGYDYISVIGYASSSDGYTIDQRHIEPAYIPSEDFEYRGPVKPTHISHMYVSGGGYGGAEDPRLTRIDDRVYMTYVAFDGYNPPRVALTSILLDDFLNHRWLWERPVIISPPGVVDKNAVIFPEKINGKYVVMHRIYPDILIDFVDTLNFDGTWWLKGEHKISPRPNMWDSRKLGAGAPPIKTKDGWLLIYQSVGNQDPGKYKIGAMLLDLNDPTKVLHRANAPILEPTEQYENNGFKAGVAYPCGAVVIDRTLFVYYGAADSYVCLATANLDEFLTELKYSEISKLDPAIINKVQL
ncbi:MAG TPA: hypothetical protein PLS49_04250 [Candidatus Woesebacteria bacterium]|nr:hypothetical protein [Candidatus Woesebacteria bacterium]